MLLSNEYILIPHVKLALKYDNNVESSVILKTDDLITCQYKDKDKTSIITGKIGRIGYKLNSSLEAVERSIYLQVDGSKEYDGKVVYINIDDVVGIKVLKTGSMISNPVCTVDNNDQSVALIRENPEGKLEYSKNGIDWKLVATNKIGFKKKKKDPVPGKENGETVPPEGNIGEHAENPEHSEGNSNSEGNKDTTNTPPVNNSTVEEDDELTEEYLNQVIGISQAVSSIKDDINKLKEKIGKLPEEIKPVVDSDEINALKLKVEEVYAKFSTIKTKEDLFITRDEAKYLREKIDESIVNVSKLGEKINALPIVKYEAVELDMASVKNTIADMKEKLGKLIVQDKFFMTADEAKSLRERVSAATEITSGLKDKISTLPIEELKTLKGTVDSLKEKVDKLPEQVQAANVSENQDFKTLKNTVEVLQGKVNALVAGGSGVTTGGGGSGSGASSDEINAIKLQVSELQTKIAGIKLQDTISITKEEASALRTKVDNVTNKVTTLEANAASINVGDLNTLKENITSMQGKIKDLETNGLAAAIGENVVKKDTFDSLKGTVETLSKKVDVLNLPSTITMTKEEAAALRNKVDDAITIHRSLKSTVDGLPALLNESNSSEIGKLKSRITPIENKVANLPSNLESTLSNLNSNIESFKNQMKVFDAKLPTSYHVTEDEVKQLRNRSEEALKATARVEAAQQIIPDYDRIIRENATVLDIKKSVVDLQKDTKTKVDDVINDLTIFKQTVKNSFNDKITPIVIPTDNHVIFFKKTVEVPNAGLFTSAGNTVIVDLPEYNVFLNMTISFTIKLQGFGEWEKREPLIIIDNNYDTLNLDSKSKETFVTWRYTAHGKETSLPFITTFNIPKGSTQLRIQFKINGNGYIKNPSDDVSPTMVFCGTGV